MKENSRTGYPSIDKPHYKYYRTEPIREFDTNQTIYQLVFNSNINNMGYDSIGYFGNCYTYEVLKKEVDKTARAYQKAGVKSGDVVALAMINTPEVAVNLLALNKIGAISKWVTVKTTPKDLERYITEHNCEIMVALDMLVPQLDEVIKNTDVKRILTVNPSDSLSKIQRIMFNLKNKLDGNKIYHPNDSRFISFHEFVKEYYDQEDSLEVTFDKEKPSVIVQSSGTTGDAKNIVHGDYSFTSFVKSISYSDLPFEAKKKLLVVVPPFVAYGLANSLFLALSFGMKAELYPKLDPDAIFKNLGKFNHCFAAPLHYRYLADNINKIKPKYLKQIECLITGGDKISVEELIELKEILGVGIINGYGNNEGLGAVTVNPYIANKFGSVGIPKYGDKVMIMNEDKTKELKYNERGEICFASESSFIEYSDNIEETNRIKKRINNEDLIFTGDIGYIDEDGYLMIDGRSERVIIRRAFKISPLPIENIVKTHPAVKDCMTVAAPDSVEEFVPMVFYSLKEEYLNDEYIEKEIKTLCEANLSEDSIPKYYSYIEEIPYTDNNKHDFRKLEAKALLYVRNKQEKTLIKK